MFSENPYFKNMYPFAYKPYDGVQYNTHETDLRQQSISGQATWTEGGRITKCGIPWSDNLYMTTAVGENTSYQCGETLQIIYPVTGRSILVEVVDKVPNYPENRLNVHRRVFETLGANPQQGVIDIQIRPVSSLEQQQWGSYLQRIVQNAYGSYQITGQSFIGKTEDDGRMIETYEYQLQSAQESIVVRARAIYNPHNNRILSIDITEV
ncbi:rare lipoprotein A [Lentibacillus persicus]|uniref:Rare lipoprotein A n=1 Tax=Lentibacillus persicus TaxID=640948 RepID=A0A1I1V3T3_9BACI|nr:RlpA-like double-psi beta-barrel domain-containing protein [Lentibacillus persicus]SFD77697.1 rare lipoprotein A [Lentibacillus persicus]